MEKPEKKNFAIGAVIGAVTGVVLGILFAPKSGTETRRDIKKTASKAAEKTLEEVRTLQTEAKDWIAKAEKYVKTTKGKAGEAAKTHVAEAKKTASHLSTVIKSFKKGKASDKDLNDAIKKANDALKSLRTFLSK